MFRNYFTDSSDLFSFFVLKFKLLIYTIGFLLTFAIHTFIIICYPLSLNVFRLFLNVSIYSIQITNSADFEE